MRRAPRLWVGRRHLAAAGLALALAALFVVPALGGNGTAHAAVDEIWTSSLSVNALSFGLGCDNLTSGKECSNLLTDDDFTYDGTTYTVTAIWSDLSNSLSVEFAQNPGDGLDTLVLNAGTATVAFADATTVFNAANRRVWFNSSPGWSDGDSVNLTITASASTAPTITMIEFTSSPASGDTYTRGERIDIKVEFDGSVEISNPHLLRLALRVGSVTEQVPRVSSTSTRSLQFFYTVKQSDLDADGISVPANPLSLNGAAITVPGDPDTAITLTHAGIADDATRKVDGSQVAAPTVQTILFQTTPLMGDTFRRGETIQVNVDFDKTLRVTGQPQLALTIGTSVRNASFVPSPVAATHVRFHYTVEAGDVDADGISVAANALSLNGGAIESADGTIAADITHPAVAADPARKVDGTLVLPPTVTSVYVHRRPEDRLAYRLGEEIRARAEFDSAIEVTGRPQLALTIGTTTRQATYSRIWQTTKMEFLYTVQASDMDADGISISADALTLNGGAISGADRAQNAVLTHAAVDDDPEHKVDGGASFAPQVTSVGFSLTPRSGETYVRGETIRMLVQFDRMAEVSGSPRVALTIGGNTRYATYHSVSTPRPFRLRFVYTVQASDMDADGISIPANAVDLNGGAITLPGEPEVAAVLTHVAVDNDATRKVDGSMAEAPTVTAVAFSGTPLIGTTYTAGETIGAYVQFDREVDATGEPQLALTIGANTRQASFIRVWESNISYILFSYIVQTSDMDADGINFPADALSLNGGTITLRGNATTDAVLTHIATTADAGRKVDGSSSAPEALSVSFSNAPSGGDTYALSEEITADIQFTKALDVSGTPRLALTIGANTRQAGFQSILGSCKCTLRFSYSVQASDMDDDGIEIASDSLSLNGGTIKLAGASSVDAVLSHSAVNADATRKVDGSLIGEIEPPGAPDLTLLFACIGCVELAWNAPDSEGGGPITGYQYQRKEGDGGYGNWTDIEDDAVDDEFVTYYDVDPNTTYTYRVRAVNAGGGGAASNERSVTTGPPIEVGVDLLEYRVAETAESVTVKVVAKVPEDWDFYKHEFQVTVATESRSATSFEDYKPITDTLTFVPSDFRNIDGQYTATKDVSIEIVDKPEAEEEESFVVLVEPAPGLASFILIPDATDTATVTIVDADHAPVIQLQKLNVVLDRTEVGRLRASDADGDELTWRIVGGADRDQFELTEDGLLSVKVARTSATLANPDDDDRDGFYEVVVEVTDGGNPVTATLSLELVDAEPPSTPLRPIVGPGDGEATAYWSAPASDGGAPIDRYEYWVHRSGRDSPLTGRTCPEEVLAQGERACALFLQSGELEDWTPVPGGAAARRVTVGNLVNGKLYQFKVRAVNAAGPGMYAWQPAEPYGEAGEPPELTVTLADQTVDDTVTTVAVARWTEPANPAGLPLVGYLFEGSRDGVEWANADGSYRSEKFFGRLIGSCSETYHSPCNRLAEFNNRRLVLEEHMTHWHFRVQALYSAGTLEVYADAPEEAKNKLRVSSPYSNVARAGDDDALPGTVAEALTVRFEDTPESHSGRAFGFRVAFNQAVAIDEASFAAHALIVGNGAVTAAARVEARPGAWEVTVAPASFAAVSVRLANPPCGEPGAVCTADGGTLEAAPAELIPGPPAGVVTAFELVDRGPGGETVTLSDGGTVELADPSALRWGIVATVADDDVKSVELKLRGPGPNEPVTKTENYAPWSLYGDANGKAHGKALPAGRYTLTATAYAEKNLGGAVLGALGIAFTVSAASGPAVVPDTEPAVTGFKLVDRVENTTVALADGMTVELADPSAQRWAIVAEVDSSAGVKSVTLSLSGAKTVSPRTENVAPWSLYGDDLTDPYGKNLPAGAYRLTATAWSEKDLGGDDLGTLRIGFTAVGPPALSVADATANEADGRIAFEVTLSRKASRPVTVDWATANGSATAGEDYTGASGTLTFEPGDTSKTVEVALLDDAVDDGGETFTVSLSNASGAVIADGEAVGTIENSDPMPSAWTARFGRSVATHVLDAVEERLDGASQSYVRLGGHQLGGSQDVREAVQRLAPDRSVWEEAESADAVGQDVTVRQLLLGSAFHLVSNSEARARGPRLSAWGRVATSGFDGREDTLSLGGTVTTAILGVDGVWKRWLTGVALAYSEGDGSFTQVEAAGGDVASALTSVHPYVAFAPSDRVRLWGMVGYGSGSLQLKLAEQGALDTGLSLTMGAVGIRGRLLEPSQTQGGLQLALRSDVLWVQMDTAATAGMVATEAEVSRLRLVLEGSRPVVLAEGGSLIPSLEVGLRHDGGDAETGSGLEVGGRLSYTSAWGLSIEASVRGLLAHEASDYQEWGASGALRFDPGQEGRGLTVSIVPTWGSAASGVSRLWGQPDAAGLAVDNALAAATGGRLDAELGYGLAALQGRGLLTPYVRAALGEDDSQAWHLGARLALASSLNLSLEASRRAREGEAAAHEVALLATLGW